jgi:hypothetical protein
MESIHDVPLSEDLKEFKDAIDKDANMWFCDHGVSYKDDCEKCDLEWANIDDATDATWWEKEDKPDSDKAEAEPDVEIDPTICDHGVDLGEPKHGACSDCDQEATNSATMAPGNIWRMVNGKKYKFFFTTQEWVPATSPYKGSWSTTPAKPLCKHFMQEFALENELVIHASADRDVPANWTRKPEDKPDLGVYLYSGWVRDEIWSTPGLEVPWATHPSWPMAHLDWPDFSIPDEPDDALIAAQWILDQLAEGKLVETGCMGGHGRTGTMLALLLVLQGVKPGTAIERVRTTYCDEAIEGNKQIDLIVYGYEQANGKKWRKSKNERKMVEDARPKSKPAVTAIKSDTTSGTTTEKHYGDAKCIHDKWMHEPCVACDKLYT